MKILVTGGTGFIGRYVVEDLAMKGYNPVILDHYNRKDSDFPVFLADITDEVAINEVMAHVDGWIHLAGVLGTQETIINPKPATYTNILGGLNILQAASQYQLPGVYIGVGNHWMNNTYSISKTTVERFIHMYNKEHNTKINIVRAVNAYGPRQRAAPPFGSSKVRKITPSFVCRALANMPIEIYGDGSQVSDMVYVTDVAKVLVLSLEAAINGVVFDEVIEVGPAKHITVKEFAELIIKTSGSTSKIVHLPMRPGEIPNSRVIANTSSLINVGLTSKDLVPLEYGLEKTIDYFRKC